MTDTLDIQIAAMTAAGLEDAEIVALAGVRVRQQHRDLEDTAEWRQLCYVRRCVELGTFNERGEAMEDVALPTPSNAPFTRYDEESAKYYGPEA